MKKESLLLAVIIAVLTCALISAVYLLDKYENHQYAGLKDSNKEEYFMLREIGNVIVEKDFTAYELDEDSNSLIAEKRHWRENIPEQLPVEITKEKAESMVNGTVLSSRLYLISPDSDVFPIKPAPENPSWVVTSMDNNETIITIIDAVNGKLLGYGIPPPYTGFVFAGPDMGSCSSPWGAWIENATAWFEKMGYSTDKVYTPDDERVRQHIQSQETALFYEIAHSGTSSNFFHNQCPDEKFISASQIEVWISNYHKMPFAFFGSCNLLCNTSKGTLSYAFRKGSKINTTVIGYCGMAADYCSNCWVNSISWQNSLFNYMSQGLTVKQAFDRANIDYPMCKNCVRFDGDEHFAIVPEVKRSDCDDESPKICQYASSAAATSENIGSEAIHAAGMPDAPKVGQCNNWSGIGYTWSPANWSSKANLTLNYDLPLYVTNVTIFGDYYSCWNKVWLKNSITQEQVLAFDGIDDDCIAAPIKGGGAFLADTVILEKCSWQWSATDAVELCGYNYSNCGNNLIEAGEECDNGNTIDGDGCSSICKLQELPDEICQYAQYAEATDESSGYEAVYSTGLPDSDRDCSTPASLHTSWRTTDWQIMGQLTLTFPNQVYPTNLTIFGDHELCINRAWLWRNNSWYLFIQDRVEVTDPGCARDYDLFNLNIKTNKVKLETCDLTWSAIDSVRLCGSINSFPKITIEQPLQDAIINNSKHSITLRISTDIISECEFSYDKNFYFNEGIHLSTANGITHSYNFIKPILMDSIEIYYKCRGENGRVSSYPVIHRFNFGGICNVTVGICDWYNCSEGAASISIDEDFYPSLNPPNATCKEELESRNLRGTYFLPHTGLYTSSQWSLWLQAYNNGHEIGGHSKTHDCSYNLTKASFDYEVQSNIDDIISNVGMPRNELITYAWPCGAAPPQYQQWLSDYYSFSRGYHFNSVESKTPKNFMNYKSINSIGIGVSPPDYYSVADITQNYQGWANYVYHATCDNPEIMDYLLAKNLWVATIGKVSKYIMERNSVKIQNIQNTQTGAEFDLINPLNQTIYNQELTLKIYMGNETMCNSTVNSIKVNGADTKFTKFKIGNQDYVRFNVLPLSTNRIEIIGLQMGLPRCGDTIVNGNEECDDGNNMDWDGCSGTCRLQELPDEICQYAINAEATSELPGYEATYSTGLPNGDSSCSTPPSTGISWQKTNWNVIANLTLNFVNSVYPNNLTIFGDYDLCIVRIWLWRNNSWYLISKGASQPSGSVCTNKYNLNSANFKTNRIKIETCSWTWSAIDAVQLCGSVNSFPKINIEQPLQDAIINNSKNEATIRISTDIVSECEFSYDRNFDFNEGISLSTTNGLTHSYNLAKPSSTDSIEIYYKCKSEDGKVTPHSTMHRFEFKDISKAFIEICNWHNCLGGAASFSMDDGYHTTSNIVYATCKEELESRNLKGTYPLSFTNLYSPSDWQLWNEVYNNGHEIAGHSQTHNCSSTLDQSFFTNDIEANINDITSNTVIPRNKLISFAWPCGIALPQYKEWLSDYYLFSRGYHINSIESKNPEDFLNYKSINSIGYGLPPPDYYLMADVTKNYQDWVNYVYHDSCDNPEIMDHLLANNLWVAPIGEVSKYIKERNSVKMQNIQNTQTGVKFDLINPLNTATYNKELTMQIYLGNGAISNILVNGANKPFIQFKTANQSYIKFSVSPLALNEIEIVGLHVDIPYCGDGSINQGSEECDDGNLIDGDGCDSDCKKENSSNVYVILYVGNIDGNASPQWYPFYDRLASYFENNKIPVGFSFFPAYIRTDNDFAPIFKRMYLADNIELFQKGFTMNETEEHLDQLPLEQQRELIKIGQYYYINKMKEILNSTNISIPVTYVAPFSRFTTDTRRAIEELGFKTNFGLYHIAELGPVGSTATLDSMQYGVSFTVSGSAGRNTVFKQPDQIIQEVLSYNRFDIEILKINGKRVVPLYVHHPDFEDPIINAKIDENKWQIYNETITRLANNPDVTLLTANQVWNLRHPVCTPTSIPETFCNRIDDDCDGIIDEDFAAPPITCGIGACQSAGTLQCIGYEIPNCHPGMPAANDSACDGIDNDCDGAIDEDCLKSIALNKGWNLISIPVELENKSVKDVFKNVEYSHLLAYTNNKWYKLDNNSFINETMGYWINSSKNQVLAIEGNKFNNPKINLNNGWNLIGYPYLEQKEISSLFNNVTVFAYNSSKWSSYDSNRPTYLNTLNKFSQGYGYWISQKSS